MYAVDCAWPCVAENVMRADSRCITNAATISLP